MKMHITAMVLSLLCLSIAGCSTNNSNSENQPVKQTTHSEATLEISRIKDEEMECKTSEFSDVVEDSEQAEIVSLNQVPSDVIVKEQSESDEYSREISEMELQHIQEYAEASSVTQPEESIPTERSPDTQPEESTPTETSPDAQPDESTPTESSPDTQLEASTSTESSPDTQPEASTPIETSPDTQPEASTPTETSDDSQPTETNTRQSALTWDEIKSIVSDARTKAAEQGISVKEYVFERLTKIGKVLVRDCVWADWRQDIHRKVRNSAEMKDDLWKNYGVAYRVKLKDPESLSSEEWCEDWEEMISVSERCFASLADYVYFITNGENGVFAFYAKAYDITGTSGKQLLGLRCLLSNYGSTSCGLNKESCLQLIEECKKEAAVNGSTVTWEFEKKLDEMKFGRITDFMSWGIKIPIDSNSENTFAILSSGDGYGWPMSPDEQSYPDYKIVYELYDMNMNLIQRQLLFSEDEYLKAQRANNS